MQVHMLIHQIWKAGDLGLIPTLAQIAGDMGLMPTLGQKLETQVYFPCQLGKL